MFLLSVSEVSIQPRTSLRGLLINERKRWNLFVFLCYHALGEGLPLVSILGDAGQIGFGNASAVESAKHNLKPCLAWLASPAVREI